MMRCGNYLSPVFVINTKQCMQITCKFVLNLLEFRICTTLERFRRIFSSKTWFFIGHLTAWLISYTWNGVITSKFSSKFNFKWPWIIQQLFLLALNIMNIEINFILQCCVFTSSIFSLFTRLFMTFSPSIWCVTVLCAYFWAEAITES